jgi:hypothetical protein
MMCGFPKPWNAVVATVVNHNLDQPRTKERKKIASAGMMSRTSKDRVKKAVKAGDATALEKMLQEDLTGINERDFVCALSIISHLTINLVGDYSINVFCHG